MLHRVTANFHALRHAGDVANREEEVFVGGELVNVTACWFENSGDANGQIAVVEFEYQGDKWDAIFDDGYAPTGTFQAVEAL